MARRLIGSDGKLTVGSFGELLEPSDTLVIGTWYLVFTVGSASVFPDGATAGYMFKATAADTLATGDSCKAWASVDLCDVQSWGLEFSKGEVDVTTMCDSSKVYRAAKTDITGTLEGVFTVGVTDSKDGFQNQFVSIVKQDDDATEPYVIDMVGDATIIAQLYTDKTTVEGEWESFYLVPLTLTGFSASAGGDEAQAFSSGFRVAPTDGASIAFYEYKNPVTAP